jgi:hypothetical protein
MRLTEDVARTGEEWMRLTEHVARTGEQEKCIDICSRMNLKEGTITAI